MNAFHSEDMNKSTSHTDISSSQIWSISNLTFIELDLLQERFSIICGLLPYKYCTCLERNCQKQSVLAQEDQ